MCHIIYIGYGVINILDVMSYLYGCDVIMCSYDVMHTECDVIPIVCNVIWRVGLIQLIHWVWQIYLLCCHVCDAIYSVCDVMKAVDVMWLLHWCELKEWM